MERLKRTHQPIVMLGAAWRTVFTEEKTAGWFSISSECTHCEGYTIAFTDWKPYTFWIDRCERCMVVDQEDQPEMTEADKCQIRQSSINLDLYFVWRISLTVMPPKQAEQIVGDAISSTKTPNIVEIIWKVLRGVDIWCNEFTDLAYVQALDPKLTQQVLASYHRLDQYVNSGPPLKRLHISLQKTFANHCYAKQSYTPVYRWKSDKQNTGLTDFVDLAVSEISVGNRGLTCGFCLFSNLPKHECNHQSLETWTRMKYFFDTKDGQTIQKNIKDNLTRCSVLSYVKKEKEKEAKIKKEQSNIFEHALEEQKQNYIVRVMVLSLIRNGKHMSQKSFELQAEHDKVELSYKHYEKKLEDLAWPQLQMLYSLEHSFWLLTLAAHGHVQLDSDHQVTKIEYNTFVRKHSHPFAQANIARLIDDAQKAELYISGLHTTNTQATSAATEEWFNTTRNAFYKHISDKVKQKGFPKQTNESPPLTCEGYEKPDPQYRILVDKDVDRLTFQLLRIKETKVRARVEQDALVDKDQFSYNSSSSKNSMPARKSPKKSKQQSVGFNQKPQLSVVNEQQDEKSDEEADVEETELIKDETVPEDVNANKQTEHLQKPEKSGIPEISGMQKEEKDTNKHQDADMQEEEDKKPTIKDNTEQIPPQNVNLQTPKNLGVQTDSDKRQAMATQTQTKTNSKNQTDTLLFSPLTTIEDWTVNPVFIQNYEFVILGLEYVEGHIQLNQITVKPDSSYTKLIVSIDKKTVCCITLNPQCFVLGEGKIQKWKLYKRMIWIKLLKNKDNACYLPAALSLNLKSSCVCLIVADKNKERLLKPLYKSNKNLLVGPSSKQSPKKQADAVKVATYSQVEAYYKKLKNEFDVNIVPADGNCLFRALAHQLSRVNRATDHKELRKQIAQHIQNHRNEYQEFVINRNFDQYVQALLDDGTFGGDMELLACAAIYSVRVLVHDIAHDRTQDFASAQQITLPTLYIAFTGNHYDSLTPISERGKELAQQQASMQGGGSAQKQNIAQPEQAASETKYHKFWIENPKQVIFAFWLTKKGMTADQLTVTYTNSNRGSTLYICSKDRSTEYFYRAELEHKIFENLPKLLDWLFLDSNRTIDKSSSRHLVWFSVKKEKQITLKADALNFHFNHSYVTPLHTKKDLEQLIKPLEKKSEMGKRQQKGAQKTDKAMKKLER